MTRNIGPAGLDLVKSFEGYSKELNDGSGRCTAYQEKINGKLDRATIGWGCTKGVTMGMVWTREEAEAALLHELEGHAKRVDRLVTVELTDHERDALISFDYNAGGLTTEAGASGVLKAINSGDRTKTVEELKRWTKFGGKESKGLVARRAAEVALFLKPVEAVASDYMPQAPEQAPKTVKITRTQQAIGGAAVASTALHGARTVVDQGKEIKSVVEDARGLIPPVPKSPDLFLYGGILAAVAAVAFLILHRRSA